MFSGMSDNYGGDRSGFTRRVLSKAEQDQQEIQDWLNANGGIVVAGVVGLVVLFVVLGMVF